MLQDKQECYHWNKNVDIKCITHNEFLETPSSGTRKAKRLERQKIFGSKKTKGKS